MSLAGRAAAGPDAPARSLLGPPVAGLVCVLVGLASSYAIILQAGRAMGLDADGLATMTCALALGMGLTSLVPSLVWRLPIVTAWSTPGAALLATSLAGVSPQAAVGAFVACGLALAAVGASGRFEALMARVPLPLASALLAGILARFGLEAFGSLQSALALAAPMLVAWVLARRFAPRWAVPLVLACGVGLAWTLDAQALAGARAAWSDWTLPAMRPIAPAVDLAALLGVALPLFVVTMASQNVPGVAVLRASGYGHAPVSKVVAITGLATAALAPFGVFALNLAAITAALCMGRDAHPDPARRWLAAVWAGVFYLLAALAAPALAGLFVALPRAVIVVLAGLALVPTIARGLAQAVEHEPEREPALVAFLVAASGVTIAGLGSAFWAIVLGLAVRAAWRTPSAR